jgi:hypothetical protein
MSKYSKFGLNNGGVPVDVAFKKSDKAVWLYAEIGIAEDKYPKRIMLFYPNSAVEFQGKKMIKHTEGPVLTAARERWRADVCSVLTALAGGTSASDYNDAILKLKPRTPQEFVEKGISLLPPDWKENKVDLFLEWGRPNEEGKSYLQVPMSSEDGAFICKGTNPGWQEDTADGLKYAKDGRQHPFSRSFGYMKSKKANRPAAVVEGIPPVKATRPADDDDDIIPF